MRKMIIAAIVTATLCGTANGATYAFTAGSTTGTITTGSAATQDSAYYLLQGIKFDKFIDFDTGAEFKNLSSLYLENGAAFNPSTNDFATLRYGSYVYGSSGAFDFAEEADDFDRIRFYTSGLSVGEIITASGSNPAGVFMSSGRLRVQVPGSPAGGAVPEPATWAMMMLGFSMVGAASRYRRRMGKASLV